MKKEEKIRPEDYRKQYILENIYQNSKRVLQVWSY